MDIAGRLIESAYLQKLAALSQPQQYGVLFCLLALLCLYSGYVWIWPEWQISAELPVKYQDLEQKRQQNEKLHQSLNAQNSAGQLAAIEQKLSPFIYAEPNVARFAKIISQSLAISQTHLVSLKNQPVKQSETFIIHQWQLQVEGDYRRLIRFLTLLIERPELLVFDAVAVKKEQDRLRLDLTVSLHQLINDEL